MSTSRVRISLLIAVLAACRAGDTEPRPDKATDAAVAIPIDASSGDGPADSTATDASGVLIDARIDAATDATDAALDAAIDAAPHVARFRTIGALGEARTNHAAALLLDGRVLVVGGYTVASGNWSATAEIFNPATETFSALPPMAFAHYGVRATTLADGRVLVTGPALVPDGLAPKTELFTPTTNTFSAGPDTIGTHASHAATLLADGRVLISGETVEAYNPTTGTFQALPPLGVLGPGHEALRLANSRVLLSGGPHQGSSGGGTREDAEELDPLTGTFAMTGRMATARAAHTITALPGGRALVAGGYIGLGGAVEVYDTAEIYDAAARTFSAAAPMTTSREMHAATALADGRVLVTGGVSDGSGTAPDNVFSTVATAEVFDLAARTFTGTATPMSVPRSHHTATRLLDGRVLVVGGESTHGGPPIAVAEVYEP